MESSCLEHTQTLHCASSFGLFLICILSYNAPVSMRACSKLYESLQRILGNSELSVRVRIKGSLIEDCTQTSQLGRLQVSCDLRIARDLDIN